MTVPVRVVSPSQSGHFVISIRSIAFAMLTGDRIVRSDRLGAHLVVAANYKDSRAFLLRRVRSEIRHAGEVFKRYRSA
jgi:hypothetical protein